jgi:chromosome segregation ATPase
MLRTSVLCCAMAGVLALAVGCDFFGSKGIKPRDEAVAAMKTELDKLDKKVAELKEKAEKATGDEKAKLEARWKESSAKREAVGKKLEEMKSAAIDKWEAVKKDADTAFGEFKKSVGD